MSGPVTASAPVRLDFAGGWTDVNPFAAEEGGVVVNAAILPRVHVEYQPGGEGFAISAPDLGLEVRLPTAGALVPAGPLALHVAALRMLPPVPGTLRTSTGVPPGSGLGSSGALDVALIAALAQVRGERLEPAEMANLGWLLETVEACHPGGRQDQYSAALGGFHRFAFGAEETSAYRLALESEFMAELARRLLICYTGRSRLSGETIARVMSGFSRRDPGITGALRELKEIALAMAAALEAGSFDDVARLLDRNWECQQRLDPAMCTPEMARLEVSMRRAGAAAAKAAGAGAGGCMMFLMGDDPDAGRQAAMEAGATVLPGGWSMTGVTAC